MFTRPNLVNALPRGKPRNSVASRAFLVQRGVGHSHVGKFRVYITTYIFYQLLLETLYFLGVSLGIAPYQSYLFLSGSPRSAYSTRYDDESH